MLLLRRRIGHTRTHPIKVPEYARTQHDHLFCFILPIAEELYGTASNPNPTTVKPDDDDATHSSVTGMATTLDSALGHVVDDNDGDLIILYRLSKKPHESNSFLADRASRVAT